MCGKARRNQRKSQVGNLIVINVNIEMQNRRCDMSSNVQVNKREHCYV